MTFPKVLLPIAASMALVGLATVASTMASDAYKVDGVHSSLIFRIKHMDVNYFHGRFNAVSGTFLLDEAQPAKSSFEFEVKADSIDTAIPKRDQHLKGPDFFNAKQFPTISFKSKQVNKSGKGSYEVLGDLQLHGVTKPVKLTVEQTGSAADPKGGHRAGFESVFTINRSDFGMASMPNMLGDEVRITANLEATRP